VTKASFHTKLHGVTHVNADGSHRQDLLEDLFDALEEAAPVELEARREPDNAFDPNAIAVFDGGGRQLGYLSREVARQLGPQMDRGARVRVLAEVVTGGGLSQNYGVNVCVSVDTLARRRSLGQRSTPAPTPGRHSAKASTQRPPTAMSSSSVTAQGAGSPRWVSTEVFLAEALRHRLGQVAVSIDYEVSADGYVERFNFVLMAPLHQQPTDRGGDIDQLEALPVQDARLRDLRGRDDGGSLWFLDGYRLAAKAEWVEPTRGAYPPFGRQVSAVDRVLEFTALLERIHRAGLVPQIVGSGVGPIVEWVKNTARAADDPRYRAELDRSHGPVRASR